MKSKIANNSNNNNSNSNRNISAPFQRAPSLNESTLNNTKAINSSIDSDDLCNRYNFPILEESAIIEFDRYCGPTPESNWVLPGIILFYLNYIIIIITTIIIIIT